MKRGPQGTWVKRTEIDAHRAFVPHALPPSPGVDLTALAPAAERANRALGRLDGVAMMLPDPRLFLSFCVRKEALLSSQLSGVQTTLTELLLSETFGPAEETREVARCLTASEHALELLRGGLPLSMRFLKEVQEVLVPPPRHAARPAPFRRAPVWIGGASPGSAVFVPPPWNEVARCMLELENAFDDPSVPALIRAGLVHAQLETIHPFLEANGRLGRILITVMLVRAKALSEPWLGLSLYFRQHRTQYAELLMGTRETGDWEAWLEFFLHAVEVTAEYGHFTARKMLTLFAEQTAALERLKGAQKKSVLAVYHQLQRRPICDAKRIAVEAGTTPRATAKALERLEQLGIVSATDNGAFVHDALVALLEKDLPL